MGCAYVDVNSSISRSVQLPKYCNSYTAEVVAIKLALQYVSGNMQTMPRGAVILTDSKSALTFLSSGRPQRARHPLFADILQLLYNITSTNFKVNFVWIKGHSGIRHNEVADDLARQGAAYGQLLDLRLPLDDFLPVLQRFHWQQWILDYNISPTGIFYKALQEAPPRRAWFRELYNARSLIVLMCRLRSNHGLSPSYVFHKLGKNRDPSCNYCGFTEGNFEHLTMSCPGFSSARQVLFRQLTAVTTSPFNYMQLLYDKTTFPFLYNFMKRCNIPV